MFVKIKDYTCYPDFYTPRIYVLSPSAEEEEYVVKRKTKQYGSENDIG